MALILTRSPYHISRGTLDANASASVTIGRIDGGSVDVVEEYVLNFRDNLFIDISKLCSSVYTPSYSYVGVWNQYITNVVGEESLKFYETGYITVTISGSINGVAQADQVTNHVCADGYVYSSEKIDKDFIFELENNSFYAGSSDTIYKLDGYDLRIPIFNP